MTKHALRLAVVFASVAAPSLARAEDTDLDRARSLYEQAGELERRGDYADAQEKLREAIGIHETPHLRYALGWALENDDKLVAARNEYEIATRLADHGGADEVRRLATARLLELERITPVVQIRLADAATDRAAVDGHAILVRGDTASAPVDPGFHRIRVERPGGGAYEQRVFVPRAVVRLVDMRSVSLARNATSTTLPWILVGGGATVALAGVAVLAWSSADASSRDDKTRRWCDATACTNGNVATKPETPSATALRTGAAEDASRGNTKQVVGGVLGAAGVVTAGVGVYMLLRNRDREAEVPRVQVGGAPTPGGAAGFATLRF